MRGGVAIALVCVCTAVAGASADDGDLGAGRVALLRLDSLGMDADRVARLETLFRIEIERLSPERPPSARAIRDVMRKPNNQDCGGEPECLVAIGKELGADVVVVGNVASLADAFVVNIKAVSVASGEEIGRVASEPLRGNPDELIENVRHAAYRLLAPSKLRGSISLVADIDGAEVLVDGVTLAKTPLVAPIANLAVGERKLEVRARGYKAFSDVVAVEFEKTTQVIVTLSGEGPASIRAGSVTASAPAAPFYKRGWFWAVVGVATTAVVVGALIGSGLNKPDIVNCDMGEC